MGCSSSREMDYQSKYQQGLSRKQLYEDQDVPEPTVKSKRKGPTNRASAPTTDSPMIAAHTPGSDIPNPSNPAPSSVSSVTYSRKVPAGQITSDPSQAMTAPLANIPSQSPAISPLMNSKASLIHTRYEDPALYARALTNKAATVYQTGTAASSPARLLAGPRHFSPSVLASGIPHPAAVAATAVPAGMSPVRPSRLLGSTPSKGSTPGRSFAAPGIAAAAAPAQHSPYRGAAVKGDGTPLKQAKQLSSSAKMVHRQLYQEEVKNQQHLNSSSNVHDPHGKAQGDWEDSDDEDVGQGVPDQIALEDLPPLPPLPPALLALGRVMQLHDATDPVIMEMETMARSGNADTLSRYLFCLRKEAGQLMFERGKESSALVAAVCSAAGLKEPPEGGSKSDQCNIVSRIVTATLMDQQDSRLLRQAQEAAVGSLPPHPLDLLWQCLVVSGADPQDLPVLRDAAASAVERRGDVMELVQLLMNMRVVGGGQGGPLVLPNVQDDRTLIDVLRLVGTTEIGPHFANRMSMITALSKAVTVGM
ncbi:hypothetical protein CEUSTIGMA_g7351.t1 [Chlamydomonas eustigma]|uniref:Uncharacterized protein n=1 Tax=Chlamydomonas eustigma TaxID=1157962 RepID=A0A250X9Z0_9CHLO|nr:hypothetical protein CEUSTIGMA_g7351.t1 [Chlamydomonas eustigma]|eukprot:GAX79911.1 hypothetical protein CEUSTIGMA_g7351.t1 [Chlamydomonas eustigma]